MPKNANISKVLIQIHSIFTSPRLVYTLDHIFKQRFGMNYNLVQSLENIQENDVVIHYGESLTGQGIHVFSESLLQESNLHTNIPDRIKLIDLSNLKNEKHLPDIFACIFFHLSRLEEYLSTKDRLGRFPHQNSYLYQKNRLDFPVVDCLIEEFKRILIEKTHLNAADFKVDRFQSLPSIDIDAVFTYEGRNFARTAAAGIQNIVKLQFNEFYKRSKVLMGLMNDPNDNFELQEQLLGTKKAKYFIQVGPYGPLDKNISPKNKKFQEIILKLKANGHQIGIHPSFSSNGESTLIQSEIKLLEAIIQTKIEHSRQHFLKFELPKTYESLLAIGIKNDYSMGYSEVPGFRAGTAFPFYWYNLEKETTTELIIHPFVVMDVAYKNFLQMNVEETIAASTKFKDICRQNHAPFTFVFHNESLSNHRGWQNWNQVFLHWTNE